MSFWSKLRGAQQSSSGPDPRGLLRLPQAADSLVLAFGYRPTGMAGICFKDGGGDPSGGPQAGAQAVIRSEAAVAVERMTDDYGFTWLTLAEQPVLFGKLVDDLRAVSVVLDEAGFGGSLLCALVVFENSERQRLGLVYLYERGTFYPFAPAGPQQRDNALELRIKASLPDDVPVEDELGRWGALFSAPGMP